MQLCSITLWMTCSSRQLVVAPGFIDAHTHDDRLVLSGPDMTPKISQGVTTVVIGNCGFTIAPCKPEHRERTLKNLTHVEGMSL